MPASERRVGARSTKATGRAEDPPGRYSSDSRCRYFLGDVDDEGYQQARVVRVPLGPRNSRAVVAVIKDNRVVREAVRFQLGENLPGLGVHLGHFVVVLSPVLSDFRSVRMVGGNPDFGRIVDCLVRTFPNLRFMRRHEVEHSEEGPPFRAIPEMGLCRRFVPNLTGLLQVVVLLRIVGAVVTGFPEKLRIHLHAGRHRDQGTHVLRPQ